MTDNPVLRFSNLVSPGMPSWSKLSIKGVGTAGKPALDFREQVSVHYAASLKKMMPVGISG